MKNVYKWPNPYSSYYAANIPSENYQLNKEALQALCNGIKREASDIELYDDLLKEAPNMHKTDILFALERKKAHLNQFLNLYTYLTGQYPPYETDKAVFQNYKEGLESAYAKGEDNVKEYQETSAFCQHPQIKNVFRWASISEKENATRFKILSETALIELRDYGPDPLVINIEKATTQNDTYRTALWTGEHFQLTLMSIDIGDDIGLEVHPNTDQFIRIEQGNGLVEMGDSKDNLYFEEEAEDNYAIVVPAGKWHNITNTGDKPLKVYVIYAPPVHPHGTVQKTNPDATASKEDYKKDDNKTVFGRTPDEWIGHTKFLVKEGLEDVKRGVNALHILQEFILMGVLVGKGYDPKTAYETVEEWERTGKSRLLQESKKYSSSKQLRNDT